MNKPLRVAALGGRDPAARLDAELRQLALQLQRSGGPGASARLRRLADRVRGFTGRHAVSFSVAVALAAVFIGIVS
jgi:hypothetical protein